MKQLVLLCGMVGSLMVAPPIFAAPILGWDAVTTGEDGLPLGSGLEVTAYKVYRCGTSATGPCLAPDRVLVGTVIPPATSLDLAGQPLPQAYVVTATNKAAESVDSLKYKVVPPAAPRNLKLP
jgi:hypothetical protein